ncbi:hypothetical protein V3W47_06255 [Deinococcus sp. YIM 134068]|uniref:hypothetical protein n=1 Tax=Deinococcus lichenicola TaxID=3118910 RepID=UPI002F956427
MKALSLLVLAPLLAGCALLGPAVGREGVSAPPAVFTQAQATTEGRRVAVTLEMRNEGVRPTVLRYAAQVNWGTCGPPPYVAVGHEDGSSVTAPPAGGRLACSEVQLTRTLAPGERLTLRRTLPPLSAGTYRLNVWFDGEVDGTPARLTAPTVTVAVR